MRHRRALLYVLLALCVPVPALAVTVGLPGGGSGPGSLDAHASLDSCGIFENQIVCKIDVGFNQIDGADRYAASVTAPDGSVSDYGSVGSGGASLWVPYVGDGTYTVEVQAWGTPPGAQHAGHLLTSDKAKASGGARKGGRRVVHGHATATQSGGPGSAQANAGDGSSDSSGDGSGDTSPPTVCEQPPTDPSPDSTATSSEQAPAESSATTLSGNETAAQTLEPEAQLPDSTTAPDCPDGTVLSSDGTCCQPPASP